MTKHLKAALCAAAGVVLLVLSGCAPPPGADLTLKEGYTIRLQTATGPQHVPRIKNLKKLLEEKTDWKHLFIVHQSGRSELFWGKYRTPEAAEPNLKRAHGSLADRKRGPFPLAMLTSLPGEEIGPPKWNLLNAPGAYSVQVATYYDMPEKGYVGRKESAVEMCRQLRKRGHEAYYYHARVRSHVMIGTFDESAVQVVETPGQVKKVGHKIVDPALRSLLGEFKYFLENGIERRIRRLVRKEGNQYFETIYVKPFAVRIPRRKGEHVDGEIPRPGDGEPWQTSRNAKGSRRPAPSGRRPAGS